MTPIFYPIDLLPDWLRWLVERFNPMFYYIQHFRDLVYIGQLPSARIFWGGWIIAGIMLAIGLAVFKKTQDKFILYF